MREWYEKLKEDEDRYGLTLTVVLHLIFLIIAIFYTFELNLQNRASYMEVTLGEFRSGTLAQQAPVQQEQVATRPNPPETPPENPDPEITEPVEEVQEQVEETAKPVNLPDQLEEIVDEEVVETPETDVLDPVVVQEAEEIVEAVEPPQTQEAELVEEGVQESGVEDGSQGAPNVDQGTGNDPDRSAPYNLQWEGELNRSPMVQPLPNNQTNQEATITIRFEVFPDGSLGRVVPTRKMNPELEREVMRTLREWRFSRLPSGAPQEAQWGIITFHFVLD